MLHRKRASYLFFRSHYQHMDSDTQAETRAPYSPATLARTFQNGRSYPFLRGRHNGIPRSRAAFDDTRENGIIYESARERVGVRSPFREDAPPLVRVINCRFVRGSFAIICLGARTYYPRRPSLSHTRKRFGLFHFSAVQIGGASEENIFFVSDGKMFDLRVAR